MVLMSYIALKLIFAHLKLLMLPVCILKAIWLKSTDELLTYLLTYIHRYNEPKHTSIRNFELLTDI